MCTCVCPDAYIKAMIYIYILLSLYNVYVCVTNVENIFSR